MLTNRKHSSIGSQALEAGFSDFHHLFYMISMSLSKPFDCMPHDLLIAKLNTYGLGEQGLRLIANYQGVNVGMSYSSWQKKDRCTSRFCARSIILQYFY